MDSVSGQLRPGPPPASCRFTHFRLSRLSQRERRAASTVVLLLHRGLIWQKGKIREFFPSILFHSVEKKKTTHPGMPVISCRSRTALLIYFKVSFRSVWLITTLHGAAFPEGGKGSPGKLVGFFPWIGCPLLHPTGERGREGCTQKKQDGGRRMGSCLLPVATMGPAGPHSGCCGGLLAHKGLPQLQKTPVVCLIPALRLRGLVKGITDLRRAAFAPRASQGCLIPSEVFAVHGCDREGQ